MTRSWKSQIADEVRATSMMKPKWPDDAMAHIASLQEDNDRLRQLLSEAEKREREARGKALEEAALWHDAQAQEYTDQIAVNDAYLARGGRLSHESRANEYCDDMRSCHRRSAAAIRAFSLQSEER